VVLDVSSPPKRRWGQNFLIDNNIVRKILDCAEVQADEHIVEIGPGRGILTRALLKRGAHVTAIEIDRELADTLEGELGRSEYPSIGQASRLSIIREDALRYSFAQIPEPYKVVSNLPYNISTPILFRLLDVRHLISRMVLMLQREVAERIVAKVGGKSYGALSIILQYYAEIDIAFRVSPHCFRPRPKVDSSVICIRPLPFPRVTVKDEGLFLRIIKAAFGYRRKHLLNALSAAGFPERVIRNALDEIQCDAMRRGETLSMAEFSALSNAVGRLQL